MTTYVKYDLLLGMVEDEVTDERGSSLFIAWVYIPNDDPEPPSTWEAEFVSRNFVNGPFIDELEILPDTTEQMRSRVWDEIRNCGGYISHEWEHWEDPEQ